jgi:condensin complex subunit 1
VELIIFGTGSLTNESLRIEMESPIFRKMEDMIEYPCRSKEWFPLAEQIINTTYALGDHPDILCDSVIKKLTRRAFRPRKPDLPTDDLDAMDADGDVDVTDKADGPISGGSNSHGGKDLGDSFELAQLVFVVGHVAIKHIAHLELIEREWKRQKDEKDAGEECCVQALGRTDTFFPADKAAGGAARASGNKDGEELDQVAGNAEDDIGDRIAAVRENELLFGEESLLGLYGQMIMNIAGSPDKYKVTKARLRLEGRLTYLFAEPYSKGSGHFVVQQVPLRQLQVLLRTFLAAVQAPGRIQRPRDSIQHRHRLGRCGSIIQHAHRRKQ